MWNRIQSHRHPRPPLHRPTIFWAFRHVRVSMRRAVIGTSVSVLLVLGAWAAREASAMPPPAPGNARGLPAGAREWLRNDPNFFYPRKGFRDVIQRQKVQRRAVLGNLLREGLPRAEAEAQTNSRITTVRYCPVLCGIYADKLSPDWPTADLVDQLFGLDYGATNTLGQPGSMREHYRDMSYGTFDVQGGVFGWFPVPENGSDDGAGSGLSRHLFTSPRWVRAPFH